MFLTESFNREKDRHHVQSAMAKCDAFGVKLLGTVEQWRGDACIARRIRNQGAARQGV